MSDPLATADWLDRAETQAIVAALDGARRRTRAVGGVVRDTVMGRTHGNDIDMATELLPDEVMARAKAAGIACYPTGIEHGTVTLKLGETEVLDIAQDYADPLLGAGLQRAAPAIGDKWPTAKDALWLGESGRALAVDLAFRTVEEEKLADFAGMLKDAVAAQQDKDIDQLVAKMAE